MTEPTNAGGTAAFDEPRGGFQWTDELRAALPVVRGIRVGPLPDAEAMLAKPIELPADFGPCRVALKELNAHTGRSWVYWGSVRGEELIHRAQLARPDPEFWTDLCVQVGVARIDAPAGDPRGRSFYYRYGLRWATEVGIHLQGLSFMVALALDLARLSHGSALYASIVESMLPSLRAAIAAADDPAHADVVETLDRIAAGTPLDRLLRAWLCPHRVEWALASRADGLEDRHYLLSRCVLPCDAALSYFSDKPAVLSMFRSALLLQIHLHGEQAFPLLADMLHRSADYLENRDELAAFVVRMQVPQLPALLAAHMARKEMQAALDQLAERYPAAALKAAVEHAHAASSRQAEGWATRLALRSPDALAQALPAMSPEARERFELLLAVLKVSESPAERLPAVLRDPPWLRKERAKPLPTLEVAPLVPPGRLAWTEAERARHAGFQPSSWRPKHAATLSDLDYALGELRIQEVARERVLAGHPLQAGDVIDDPMHPYRATPDVVLLLPDAAALAVWNSYPAERWSVWSRTHEVVRAILARFGEAALPGLANLAAAYPEDGLHLAAIADHAAITPTALSALRRLKKAKPLAIAWLRAYPATALAAALPQAFGAGKAARDDAQHGLRWFLANGFEAEVHAAAAAYGTPMAQALQALLDADPLRVLPARMPKLPAFFVAPSFHRPLLRDGSGALGGTAIEHLGLMLAISELDAPYAGLERVREACTPESLAAFAWSLYETWRDVGAPSKDNWAFKALGLLGDDETARRLTPLIRDWPSEGQHQRAVVGLDVLAAIGTDVALMHLHGIASKAKNKPLQSRAREKIAAVAEARGFTAAQLADRLVPDLGLDEQGTLRLDFGPRAFTVAFDETLKPFVRDAEGVRLKDLPKPLKSDDPALAEAATEQFKQLKKAAKAVAGLQVMRLEAAMVERRRWPAKDFRLFFLDHALMRHLAARLVWGVYDADGRLRTAFRVAEDFTLADADDTHYELPADALVGIVHALELPAALQAAFGQLFADYEILQPFRQLGRETYQLTAEERLASHIRRYADKVVATGSVLGLANRGWERSHADGWVGWFRRPVGERLEVQIELDPGTHIADLTGQPTQRIPSITLREAGTWDASGLVRFEQLDPILASEVLRDADLLAGLKVGA